MTHLIIVVGVVAVAVICIGVVSTTSCTVLGTFVGY